MTRSLASIHVRARSAAAQDGVLIAGNLRVPCKLGRCGRRWLKREGDGSTPSGIWPMRQVLARRHSWQWLRTGLPFRFIAPDDGWCDDPNDRNYNRAVKLPYPAGGPTAGCIAVTPADMRKVLALCGPRTKIRVW